MSSYRYNNIELGICPFRRQVGDSSTFHHKITAVEQSTFQGFPSNCCSRTRALFKCIPWWPFDVGGTRVLVLRFSQHKTARWRVAVLQSVTTMSGSRLDCGSFFKEYIEELDGDEEADTLPSRSSSATSRTHPCLLYTSPSPRDKRQSRMPSSA